MPDARPAALLDLDGTLVDTSWIHVHCWAEALHDCGADVPMHLIARHMGMGADKLVEAVAGRDVPGAADAWSARFDEALPRVRALPGAADLIAGLHRIGRTVVLASSAPAAHLDTFLAALGGPEVDGATTADDVEASKPAPDIFAVALERAGGHPGSVALGDTVWDVESSGRAGIGCVGVMTGGIDRRDLLAAGALAVYEDAAQLAGDLASSPFAT